MGARHRRRFMLVDGEPWHEKTCRDCEYYNPDGQAAGGWRGDTQSGHCWWLMLAVSLAHTADVASG